MKDKEGLQMTLRFLGIAMIALAASAPGFAQNSAPIAPPASPSTAIDQTTRPRMSASGETTATG